MLLILECFLLFYFKVVASTIIDQEGGGSDVFRNIWQQNVNNMNQMLGKFTPCKMKFGGLNTQMNYDGQFGGFHPGIVGQNVDPSESCPCPAVDSQGCPTCLCINKERVTNKALTTLPTNHGNSQNAPVTKLETSNPTSVTTISTTKTLSVTVPTDHLKTTLDRTRTMILERPPSTNLTAERITQMSTRTKTLTNVINTEVPGNDSTNDTNIEPGKTSKLKEDKNTLNFILVGSVSGVLVIVTIVLFIILYQWRKTKDSLKHEQNELYFAQKSFRISMERQSGHNGDITTTNSTTPSRIPPPRLCESLSDSVFTLDDSTDLKSPVMSPSMTTPSSTVPLIQGGSNVFQYPSDAYHHVYLELM